MLIRDWQVKNGSKALALRATLRARGLTTIFLTLVIHARIINANPEAVRAFIPIDYFYHQENGSKALALRATLRAVGLDNHFFDDFFYPMGRKPLLHAHKKTPLNKQGLNEI